MQHCTLITASGLLPKATADSMESLNKCNENEAPSTSTRKNEISPFCPIEIKSEPIEDDDSFSLFMDVEEYDAHGSTLKKKDTSSSNIITELGTTKMFESIVIKNEPIDPLFTPIEPIVTPIKIPSEPLKPKISIINEMALKQISNPLKKQQRIIAPKPIIHPIKAKSYIKPIQPIKPSKPIIENDEPNVGQCFNDNLNKPMADVDVIYEDHNYSEMKPIFNMAKATLASILKKSLLVEKLNIKDVTLLPFCCLCANKLKKIFPCMALRKLIAFVAHIDIRKLKAYPQSCSECVTKIIDFFAYKNKIIENYTYLQGCDVMVNILARDELDNEETGEYVINKECLINKDNQDKRQFTRKVIDVGYIENKIINIVDNKGNDNNHNNTLIDVANTAQTEIITDANNKNFENIDDDVAELVDIKIEDDFGLLSYNTNVDESGESHCWHCQKCNTNFDCKKSYEIHDVEVHRGIKHPAIPLDSFDRHKQVKHPTLSHLKTAAASEYGMDMSCTPPANKAENNVMPTKSRDKYEKEFKNFTTWCEQQNVSSITEDVLFAYFENMSYTKRSSTMWANYSILRTCLTVKNKIDISKFNKVIALLKNKSENYVPKRTLIFKEEDVNKFINEANDFTYLAMKVALIIGYSGGCRREELKMMVVNDIELRTDSIIVVVPKTDNNLPRIFEIIEELWIKLVKKYIELRPPQTSHSRFFITYRKGRCLYAPMGINKIGEIPKKIATYLNLSNPELYTGHCFRRTSTSHRTNRGALITIKKQAGRNSSEIVEGLRRALYS